MIQHAPGVWQLDGTPKNGVNVYLLGDVLIDSGLALNGRSVLRQLERRDVRAHAVTHAHFDRYGASHAVCERLDIPLWVGEHDAAAVEAGRMIGRLPLLGDRMLPAARRHPVSRRLVHGDTVAGFRVLFTPGHSPGHISFWRERDRVLVCGDVLWGQNPFTMRPGIREPYEAVSTRPQRNRDSARRLSALEPELVLFGHGPPLLDPDAFRAAVERLRGTGR